MGLELLAEYNGQKFKHDDLVDIFVGTGHGVVGKKCEPLKARFKGVVQTVRGPEFLLGARSSIFDPQNKSICHPSFMKWPIPGYSHKKLA